MLIISKLSRQMSLAGTGCINSTQHVTVVSQILQMLSVLHYKQCSFEKFSTSTQKSPVLLCNPRQVCSV